MRNLKKVLSLVLCLAMMLSIMVVGAGAAFTDQDQFDGRYTEAAEVLTNLGVLKGYENGSFQPKDDITRAEVAAIIYRVVTGDVNDAQVSGYAANNQFDDVKSDDWFAGYVNYCASVGYIKGYGNGNFGPQDNVTGYQALAMILRAVGYDQTGEFTGSKWILNTATTAESRGILQNVQGENLNNAAVRELVAELIFQAMIIPTVTYTPALGYSQFDSIVVNGSNNGNLNPTLGESQFGLQQTAGEISAVGRTAGTTTLRDRNDAANGTSMFPITVTGTDTPWTDIGYAAYVWTVPTSGVKTRAAVSDVVITGESLKVTTDGTAVKDSKVTIEDNARVYLNGDYQGNYNAGKNAEQTQKVADALALAGIRGVKVDYIDNDNGGRAEVIVVTQYTVAWVTAITSADATTGTQGVKESTTYLCNGNGTIAVGASKLVTDDTLAVGDCVTYVKYADDYYVDLAAATAAKFSARNISAGAETTYTIGGSNYYISGLEYVTNVNDPNNGYATLYLNNGANDNLSKNVVIYTDPYGYIVYAEREVVPDSYLYVISNNETVANTGLTAAVVAFTDGTIDTIQVKNRSVTNSNTSYTYEANQLAGTMYAYTVDGSVYTLGKDQNKLIDGSYKNGTATFNGTTVRGDVAAPVAVDTASVVVDLRDYEVGDTSAEVFTGYGEIPTVQKAVLWYAAKENALNTGDTITYSFLLDNQNDVLKDFIVYQTTDYTEVLDKDDQTITSYKMDVVIDGAVVEDYVLTPAQFAKVQTYGVGLYSFKNDVLTEYSAFNEVDGAVASWSQGRISVQYNNGAFGGSDALVNYTYTSNNQISVLNIGSGVTGFNLVYGGNYNVYVVPNADGTSAKHIYVIVDPDDVTGVKTETLVKGDYKYTYEVSKTVAADDLTVCIGRAPIYDPADYLGKAVADTLDGVLTGEGKGTVADPFVLEATGCIAGVDKTTLSVTSVNTAQVIKIAYTAGDVASAAGVTGGTAVDEYTVSGASVPAADGNKWVFSIDGVYFVITVKALNHDTTLSAKSDADGKISLADKTVTVYSVYAGEGTFTTELAQAVLSANGVNASFEYKDGKIIVTAECGHTAEYNVIFAELPPAAQ